ncbi:hypothetical protein AB0L65_37330 [Nonomuraea sp. NPDC052116]|uniref:hypothetical protein n=1 Tax=Nonomuraea sp. NPDC052116 TaxID=3155665 RepID=UPI0034363EC7
MLQFFVILAGLIPLTVLGLIKVGGFSGLADKVRQSPLGEGGLPRTRSCSSRWWRCCRG